MYVKASENVVVFPLLCLHDILHIGNGVLGLQIVKFWLRKNFLMKDPGEAVHI